MSEKAISKLRIKFICLLMLALFLAMSIVSGLLYVVNVLASRQVIEETLDVIIEYDGDLGDSHSEEIEERTGKDSNVVRFLDDIFQTSGIYESPEFAYSTRYFAVIYDKKGEAVEIKTSHIAAISDEEAEEYGAYALDNNRNFGRKDSYYYKWAKTENGTVIVVYLDASQALQSSKRLLHSALILIGFGIIITYFFVLAFSRYIVKSEIKNAELQKQFITNASHELKTPLAVIRANNEMTEMLNGETEWTESTNRQIDRMNGLIKNLVLIARSEEGEKGEIVKVDVSRVINETVDSFKSVSNQESKKLEKRIDDNVMMNANDASIRQLATILLDNALKYCDEEGTVEVVLCQRGKGIFLSVSNSYEAGKDVDYTKFFERFYREDESHNVDRGGYGIGLSIAEELVKRYKGTINATWKDGVISFNCVLKGVKKIDQLV